MLSITHLVDKMTSGLTDYEDWLCFKLPKLFLSKISCLNYKGLGMLKFVVGRIFQWFLKKSLMPTKAAFN